LEHLLENNANKWSTFVKMTQKSGAPRKYTGFQRRIPCLDARMGMWAQSAYLAKDWARRDIFSVKMKNKIHY
jgi:hypothetical protein